MLKAEGFGARYEEVIGYRNFVRNMSVENRREIFFLRVNDEMFKPYINPIGNVIDSEVHDLALNRVRITDYKLTEKQAGYFVIAASST